MIGRENINQIWASLIVEECYRNGADTFFLAPGSRCTPLTTAVARHPEARVMQHFDERGLGFAALGYARATGRPGVIICTSGTAVSNLLPAVVEARKDAQPMLLLTADRPPELRATGANQAIDQVDHFGRQTRWAFDLPCPDTAITPAFVLSTLDQALHRTRRGPVQLNCMFREPLAATVDPTLDAGAYLTPVKEWLTSKCAHTGYNLPARQVDDLNEAELSDLIHAHEQVLVIAGGGLNEPEALAVDQLASRRNWPVVTDITSGLHFGPHRNGVVRHIDALVGPAGFPQSLRPQVVLQFGTRFLSKRLLQALEATPLRSWIQAARREGRFDPLHRVTHRFEVDIDRFCLQLERSREDSGPPDWKQAWLNADRRVEESYQQHLDNGNTLSEPAVARALTRLMPNLHGLVPAASMPVRDLNQFAARNPHVIHVACNRGASGIDGTLATAAGFARGLRQGVTVLIGDLATLHDLNSLALVARESEPIIVVVINNQGGGIFHFLPVAEMESIFEPYFATPHDWHFRHAARMFRIEYARPETMPDFVRCYKEALQRRGPTLIEVQTDRQANVAQHEALRESLRLEIS